MRIPSMLRRLLLLVGCTVATAMVPAQVAPVTNQDAELQFVVALSRHGVRSPITTGSAIDKFSAAPWPQWDVPPGYLTPHGYELMKMFGAWDRTRFSALGLFGASGCADAAHVAIFADSDQRTRETGKALAQGMFPGCTIDVHARPEGTADPLFSPLGTIVQPKVALVAAAMAGRIGGNANNLTEAYRPQLAALDRVLAGCGHAPTVNTRRTSIFDVPAGLGTDAGFGPASRSVAPLRGPLPQASVLAENLLLEYTQGMSNVGWGCVDGAKLRDLMQLDTAWWDFGSRTSLVARMIASNLLDHIEKSMDQSVTGKPVAGALGKPGTRLLILVGHDTNIATVAGALGIDWIIDGRVDDTPPGGALLFELWRPRAGGPPFVRLEYTAQTLEQMRAAQALSPANPPAREPIFVPGCSRADSSCSWEDFSAAATKAIDPAFVSAKP